MSKAREVAKMGEVLTNSQIGGRRNIIINGAMHLSKRAIRVTSVLARTAVIPDYLIGGFGKWKQYINSLHYITINRYHLGGFWKFCLN